MADIYVRPYGNGSRGRNPVPVFFAVLIITALVIGVLWWLSNRGEKVEKPKPAVPPPAAPVEPAVQSRPQTPAVQPQQQTPPPARRPSTPAPSPVQTADSGNASQMFTQAQSLANAGKLKEASDLLSQVIKTTTDESLRNNALRVQGRINVQLFLSATPTPEKKPYVIQPGDSLDKIARSHKTTVDLLRKMNKIDGNLIYPGVSIQVPAAPFTVNVDKSDTVLDLTMNGKLFKRYVVGLGKFGKTPVGTFTTVVHQTNPDWTSPSGGIIPFGDPRNVLGTRWMSIQDSTRPEIRGFGIHGTSERDSIGSETSNGCVRMLNEDVEELFMLIPRGTSVIISE